MKMPSKETQWVICNWIYGIIALVLALPLLAIAPYAGIACVLMALLVLPPARKFAYAKTGKTIPQAARGGLYIGLAVVAFFLLGLANESRKADEAKAVKEAQIQNYTSGKSTHLATINSLIDAGQFEQATTYANQFASLVKDQDLNDLLIKAKTEELLAKAKKTAPNKNVELYDIYSQLTQLHPKNVIYLEAVARYGEKALRDQAIKEQFSGWDGSHRGLEKIIKKNMNDPDSYDHAETVYWDKGDYLLVRTTFRGKNAYGGVVLQSIKAKVDLEGNVLQILN